MIVLDRIGLSLPGFALEEISLTINKGAFFALMGPTGSGKSLLLEGIMGLMPFTSGRLFSEGREVNQEPVEKRRFAIVYQDFALFPHLDVTGNILYGAAWGRLSRGESRARMKMLVQTLGLGRILDRRPHNLSGGEKQRVALARSLMLDPQVLLLDEPLSALDPVYRDGIRIVLKNIHRRLGITTVMVSHNFQDVVYLADSGAIIRSGRLVQQGRILDLFEAPVSRFAADFVGMKNICPFKVEGNCLVPEGTGVNIAPAKMPGEGRIWMGIRPEEILPDTNGPPERFSGNRFQGTVSRISDQGGFAELGIRVNGMVFQARWPRPWVRGLDCGAAVAIAFPREAVHTF